MIHIHFNADNREMTKFVEKQSKRLFVILAYDIICLGATIHGRRLALYGGAQDIRWMSALRRPKRERRPVTLRLHRNPQGNSRKGGRMKMLTIEGLIAVISLVLTAFGLGYAIGRNDKTQK